MGRLGRSENVHSKVFRRMEIVVIDRIRMYKYVGFMQNLLEME